MKTATAMEKGDKHIKGKVASDESITIYLYPVALRKAKTMYNFGLSECKRVKDTCFRDLQQDGSDEIF